MKGSRRFSAGMVAEAGKLTLPARAAQALAAAAGVIAIGGLFDLPAPAGCQLPPIEAPTGLEPAGVAAVIDGDTLALSDGRRLRILGIDAPETRHPDMAAPQAFGQEAFERLKQLTQDRGIALESEVQAQDAYGRSLRHVWLDGQLVAEILVCEGLAHARTVPPNQRYAQRLRLAEADARHAARGLWSLPKPSPLPVFSEPTR